MMKTKIRKYGVGSMRIIFVFSFVLIPYSTLLTPQASAQTKYQLLAPLPLSSPSGGETRETTAEPYIKGIFNLIIAVAGGLAVIMLTYGGIKYMSTEAIGGKSDAKDTIKNAIWGLLLIIGAWLILYTINPKLVEFDLKIASQASGARSATTGGTAGTPGSSGTPLTGLAGELLSQQVAMSALKAGDIDIVGNPSLAGLRQGVIDELIALKNACGCKVAVNDATGGGHDTVNEPVCNHQNGYKVDLSTNGGTSLTNYIKKNYQPAGQWSNGTQLYKSPSGAIYADEKNHWDVARC